MDIICGIFFLVIPLLLAVAFLTLFERKVLAAMQKRQGPNIVGLVGLFQPFADALKLLAKENLRPIKVDYKFFFVAPIVFFVLSLLVWSVIYMTSATVLMDFNIGFLLILTLSSLTTYGVLLAGWSSNSIYGFLGSLRSSAQMISYEISVGPLILGLIVIVGSFNIGDFIDAQRNLWFIIPFFPIYILFLISALAETARIPFDLPEAEGELVAGYNVEYSASKFVLFFIAEYANIIFMSTLLVLLFCGGWHVPFVTDIVTPLILILFFQFKVLIHVFFIVWIRAAFPRYRYDQLMRLGWKVFLPLAFGWYFFCVFIINIISLNF